MRHPAAERTDVLYIKTPYKYPKPFVTVLEVHDLGNNEVVRHAVGLLAQKCFLRLRIAMNLGTIAIDRNRCVLCLSYCHDVELKALKVT